MTRKRVAAAIRRRIPAGELATMRIRVFRRRGRCVATITHRKYFTRVLAASAPTWQQAERQVCFGFVRGQA